MSHMYEIHFNQKGIFHAVNASDQGNSVVISVDYLPARLLDLCISYVNIFKYNIGVLFVIYDDRTCSVSIRTVRTEPAVEYGPVFKGDYPDWLVE